MGLDAVGSLERHLKLLSKCILTIHNLVIPKMCFVFSFAFKNMLTPFFVNHVFIPRVATDVNLTDDKPEENGVGDDKDKVYICFIIDAI